MNADLQVSSDGCFILVAEPFVDILVHERRLADPIQMGVINSAVANRGIETYPLSPKIMT
jgi:hypothetical protein